MYTIDVPKKEQPYCLSGLVRSVSWFFNIETNKNLQNTAVSHVVYFLLEWRRSKWQRVGGWDSRIHVSVICHPSYFLSTCCYLQCALLQSLLSILSLCLLSQPCLTLSVLCPPQTVEHGFPHQPSALSYSPSLQLLAIGTRSGAIKLYPSLYLRVNSCQGGIWASCLNLRQR